MPLNRRDFLKLAAASIVAAPLPCLSGEALPRALWLQRDKEWGLIDIESGEGYRQACWLLRDTQASGVYAVIAPNMCKQIVALQAALAQMAADFPGAFAGYALSVVESHQASKADTSGTAKAVSDSLSALVGGAPFDHAAIVRVREAAAQLAGGGAAHEGVSPVPREALDGHAFHTYALKAEGVEFQIRHNVSGRATYAEGAVDAVHFLARQVAAKSEQRLYSMIDVLKAGALS